MNKRTYLMVSLVISSALAFSLLPVQTGNAAAGTTGELDPVVSFYNPGTPYMLKMKTLTDSGYYALLVGANLATANQVWYNFTASGSSNYYQFNINTFTTETKLQVKLYGALNDSDTTATVLDTIDLQVINSGTFIAQDWFLGVAFIIVIFFIFVGIVVALVQRKKD